MTGQESTTSIRDWVEDETRHIDVVASWESLCDTYETLRFTDPLSDAERLEEFRWIVQQMNSFLTRMRSKLMSCKDMDAMLELLRASFTPAGKVDLSSRRALVYQKLRQQWVSTAMSGVMIMMEMEEEQDGWQD